MSLKPLWVRTVMIGVALVAGITVGTLSYPAITFSNQSDKPAPVYQRNENGQTYGSDMYATSLDTVPDLVLAQDENGTVGYVRSVDLYGKQPKTPEEAVKMNLKPGSFRHIPLYAVDGKTVIGKFKIGPGNVEKNQKATNQISP
ncbi:MAG: peptidase M56 BlaR1 [Marinilabiliales bacterium]|nr:MAG: peptidase M56 BlaR1 [Marinilabiliales bacterium]